MNVFLTCSWCLDFAFLCNLHKSLPDLFCIRLICVYGCVCVYLPPVSYTWIFNEKDFDIFSKCIVCDVFLNVFYV